MEGVNFGQPMIPSRNSSGLLSSLFLGDMSHISDSLRSVIPAVRDSEKTRTAAVTERTWQPCLKGGITELLALVILTDITA